MTMETVRSSQLGGTDLKYHPNKNKSNQNSGSVNGDSSSSKMIASYGVKDVSKLLVNDA